MLPEFLLALAPLLRLALDELPDDRLPLTPDGMVRSVEVTSAVVFGVVRSSDPHGNGKTPSSLSTGSHREPTTEATERTRLSAPVTQFAPMGGEAHQVAEYVMF